MKPHDVRAPPCIARDPRRDEPLADLLEVLRPHGDERAVRRGDLLVGRVDVGLASPRPAYVLRRAHRSERAGSERCRAHPVPQQIAASSSQCLPSVVVTLSTYPWETLVGASVKDQAPPYDAVR